MKSMTGFGKSHITHDNIECNIEIKSVNGRYLDLKIYLPRELGFFEFTIRKLTPQFISRGSVEIRININDYREPKLRLNVHKLKKYRDIITQSQQVLGVDAFPSLEYLLAEPGVIQCESQVEDDPELVQILEDALVEALSSLQATLIKEAEGIKSVLLDAMTPIKLSLERIAGQVQPYKENLFTTMHKRISDIVSSYQLDNIEQRIVQELAIYIDKYDIQEELTRLKSHIKSFIETLNKKSDEDIGKTLNFILQEMHREANTLGSKFSNMQTFHDVLIIKEEIEKCREIVQNVA
nr:hypothetical protein [Candidatus Cloacimonadota bacterium]